jgi:hypothetical protein
MSTKISSNRTYTSIVRKGLFDSDTLWLFYGQSVTVPDVEMLIENAKLASKVPLDTSKPKITLLNNGRIAFVAEKNIILIKRFIERPKPQDPPRNPPSPSPVIPGLLNSKLGKITVVRGSDLARNGLRGIGEVFQVH